MERTTNWLTEQRIKNQDREPYWGRGIEWVYGECSGCNRKRPLIKTADPKLYCGFCHIDHRNESKHG